MWSQTLVRSNEGKLMLRFFKALMLKACGKNLENMLFETKLVRRHESGYLAQVDF